MKSLLFKIGITTFCTEANSLKLVEQGRRIELLALAWKAKVLPLYEPCVELLIIQQIGTVVKTIWLPTLESDQGPTPYQDGALPLS